MFAYSGQKGRHIGEPRRDTSMAVRTELCKFVRNISQPMHLTLGEVPSLLISYNITIS